MRRRAKVAKAKVEGKRPPAGTGPQNEDARVRDLEKRLAEALEQQNATSQILRVISGSPTNIQPVLDTVAENAAKVCGASEAVVWRLEGDQLVSAASHGQLPVLLPTGQPVTPHSVTGRAVLERRAIHVHDLPNDPDFPLGAELARRAGHRTTLATPLLREGVPIGAILIRRREVRPFTEEQVALLKTFADQAVIAMENVRLLTELEARNRDLTEALEQQTATAQVLRVIGSSPTDAQPVFDAIVSSARRLLGGFGSAVYRLIEDQIHLAAYVSTRPSGDAALRNAFPRSPALFSLPGEAIGRRAPAVVTDSEAEGWLSDGMRKLMRERGDRSGLWVPMMKEGTALGAIGVTRSEPGGFADGQVALLETFADQAVIAIENVRLFKELEARNRDLTEALEQQTATSEILRVISNSPTNIQPVLDTLAETAARLCKAYDVSIRRVDGDVLRLAAHHGPIPQAVDVIPVIRGTTGGRSVLDRQTIHIADAQAETHEFPEGSALARQLGHRTILTVPLLREGLAIGTINLRRVEVLPFTDKQITLLQTFADQAVIAIENVRLFKELEARTQDLTRSVGELRALGEVGEAISSTLDLQTVLRTIVARATQLSGTDAGVIYEYDEPREIFVPRATERLEDEIVETMLTTPVRRGEGATGQLAETQRPVQVPDIVAAPAESRVREALVRAGYRALLAVPLVREGRMLGGLTVIRKGTGTFPPEVVELLQTFATQSALAIQNARLFLEIADKSRTLEELSRNQEQLSRLSTALQEPLSLTEQLTRVLDAARKVVGLDHLYIWTPSPAGDGLMVSAGAGLTESDSQALVGVTIPFAEAGALAAVYSDGEPRLFNETSPVPEQYRLRPHYSTIAALRLKAFLVCPMIARGRTVGVLSADNRMSRAPILAHTGDLLQSFAAQAAVAVENARLFQEIQDKSRQLEAASRHKSEFLANMSHELRTPLNAVIGFSEVLLQRMFGDLNDKQDEYLKDIYASGQHLLSLINDILDLSKIEAGRMELAPTPFHLPSALDNAVTLVRERAARHGITLEVDVDPGLGELVGDERKVKQVVLNLLSNAVKFTPEGGRVSLKAARRDRTVEIAVTDTGIGIASEDQAAVFEEFLQVGSDETRKQEGTGLGLTLARKFVELHGGRIWVESEPGRGSTFTFTLPVR